MVSSLLTKLATLIDVFSSSLPCRQRAGLPQARHAGQELQEQRGHAGDLRQVADIQAARIRQVIKSWKTLY